MINLLIAVFASALAAFIWLYFFRIIDHFKRESWSRILVFFALGGASVLIPYFLPVMLGEGVLWHEVVLHHLVDVALIEETGKIAFFLIGMAIFRSSFSDSPNHIIYGASVGLGFGFVENILYALTYGNLVLHFRDIVSMSLHAFLTGMVAYGIYKFRLGKHGLTLLWFLSAIGIHALFNSGFDLASSWPLTALISFVVFFVAIEMFSMMANNAVNASQHFEDHIPFPAKAVRSSMSMVFLVLFGVFLVLYVVEEGAMGIGVFLFVSSPLYFLLFITVNRLTSMVLVRGKTFPINPEMPFRFGGIDLGLPGMMGARFSVKGLPYEEYPFVSLINKETEIRPINSNFDYFGDYATVSLTGKVYAKSQLIFYPLRFISSEDPVHDRHYYLMPKFAGRSEVGNKLVAALICREQPIDSATEDAGRGGFCAWVYLAKEPNRTSFEHFKDLMR